MKTSPLGLKTISCLLAALLALFLSPNIGFAGSTSTPCEYAENKPVAIGKDDLIRTVNILDELLKTTDTSRETRIDVNLLLEYQSGILGGFTASSTIAGKHATKTMIYAKFGNQYVIAGYTDLDGKKQLAKTLLVSDNGESLQSRARISSKVTSAPAAAQPCPAGQTPHCTYEWNCLKKTAPGWAMATCGLLPSHAAQVACITATAAWYIAPCCKTVCMSDFD